MFTQSPAFAPYPFHLNSCHISSSLSSICTVHFVSRLKKSGCHDRDQIIASVQKDSSSSANFTRLDQLVLLQGLASNLQQARGLIMSAKVLDAKAGRVLDKPGTRMKISTELVLRKDGNKMERQGWVSRGGVKLAHALEKFELVSENNTSSFVQGCVAMDIGASTGGFTHVLLHHGAKKVYAVDVSYGVLHNSLRTDPRVCVFDRTNARNLRSTKVDDLNQSEGQGQDDELIRALKKDTPTLVVSDASFISLKEVLPATLSLVKPDTHLVALIKPQFEVPKAILGERGVVRDPEARSKVCQDIAAWIQSQGWRVQHEVIQSPIKGPEGNVEYFLHAIKWKEVIAN